MIHPQYIVALTDVGNAQFNITKRGFEFCVYLDDVKILHKIKERFKSGKVIQLESTNVLKVTKQLESIITFFRKNKILNSHQHANFLRWAYLYQKLMIEKYYSKTDREFIRIFRRILYFGGVQLMSQFEIWKDVPGYKGIYQVSNNGKVKSVKTKSLRILSYDKDGYPYVTLHGNDKPKKKFVHALVLESFVGPRPSKDHVARHYPDQDKTNNNLNNLSWSNPAQNARDRVENIGSTNLTEDDVLEIKQKLLDGTHIAADIAREYPIGVQEVSDIIRNNVWKGVGPDISDVNFDKRRILTNLEISQIKRAILDGYNSHTIQKTFNISSSVYTRIRDDKTYATIQPCESSQLPKIVLHSRPGSKLTVAQVLDVKNRISNKQSVKSIAKLFGVDTSTIYRIKNGKQHKNL